MAKSVADRMLMRGWLLVGALILAGEYAIPADAPSANPECVILLHGFGRTELSMKRMEWALDDHGYLVVNESYPFLGHGIEALAELAIQPAVDECRSKTKGRIDFVTHSLGGILVRLYLADSQLPDLKRVVMLGPPNQGSSLASYVTSSEVLDPIEPQVIKDLARDADSAVSRLGPVDFDLGVIAGDKNRRPFTPGAPEERSDGTVAVSETKVEGMKDFIVLPVTHTFMLWDRSVIEQTIGFLREGHFQHTESGGNDEPL